MNYFCSNYIVRTTILWEEDFFVKYSILPTYLAWDAFGIKNGARNLQELNESVIKYRDKSQ